MARPYRIRLTARLLLILSGTAAFSTVLALGLQDRALSADLHQGALERVERAARSTDLLVEQYLGGIRERYVAISGTPQFRATLEVGDGPTLRFYAAELAAKSEAAGIAFLDRDGRPKAAAGKATLTPEILAVDESGLMMCDGEVVAVVAVPLRTDGELVGHLLAIEPVTAELLAQWSELCGADVRFVASGSPPPDAVERPVRRVGDRELRVAISLDRERAAQAHSRRNLLTAGLVALGLAFAASIALSRSVVRPILEIQTATERIGDGDFATRLDSRRGDEIGDVARAFDGMLDRINGQRRQLESHVDRLRRSEDQLAGAQRLAHVGSFQLDLVSGELGGSDEFRRVFGWTDERKPIEPGALLDRIHPDDRDGVRSALESCLRDQSTVRIDCRIALLDAPDRILHLQARIRKDAEGQPALLEGTVQDITERKRSEEQIRFLAYHDSLTGLGNRLLCKQRLNLELAQAKRNGDILGVLFLDLDRFKRINDTLGHSQGDELLKGVADRLVDSVRASDFLGRADLANSVSRLGGDEFTAVVTVKDVQDLAKVARRILRALAEPFDLEGHEVVISGSIGITAFPFDGDDVEALLRNADAAMYHAKDQGRNNYQFYAASMNEVALRSLILENNLRRGLDHEEFELHYQPKVATGSGEVVGFEALVRWRDPEAGLIPPGVFIPIAEETGLIVPLGDWVLSEACRQAVAWRDQGHPVPISVNLSAHQFRRGALAERVLEVLEETGAAPDLLEIEITESTLMHDEAAAVVDLETLRARGIRIHVDDFGTGYSSFAYLRRLPVDVLKIDRSFVEGIADNADDASLAASIVAMGRALGLRVIAEGVETVAQSALLEEWRCDEIQGFLYGRPAPADVVAERYLGRVLSPLEA